MIRQGGIFFYFDREKLKALAHRHSSAYQSSDPFPHVVIDDFLPSEVLLPLANSLPRPNSAAEKNTETTQRKALYRGDRLDLLDPALRHLINELNSGAFIDFLESLTGVKGLVNDPHLQGGGVHQIARGGFLKIHADFNWNERLKLDRRVNLLLYLNPEWKEEYGGHLELWDEKMSGCRKKISPIFNRLVIFNTTDRSYHGHPEPLKCPEDVCRNSIALYYYSNGRPKEERRFGRNVETLYEERPGERFHLNPLRKKLKKVIPQWVFDLRSRFRGL